MTQPANDAPARVGHPGNWVERYRAFRDSRAGSALFFFAFAVLELVGVSIARDRIILGMQERTFFALGAVMFATLGLACAVPGPMKAVGKLLGAFVLIALVIGIVVAIANGVGAIPVAIIIGALIIAAAIRAR